MKIEDRLDRIDDGISKISQALIAIMTALTNAQSRGIFAWNILNKADRNNLNKEIQRLGIQKSVH
jgi:hypothetical protein